MPAQKGGAGGIDNYRALGRQPRLSLPPPWKRHSSIEEAFLPAAFFPLAFFHVDGFAHVDLPMDIAAACDYVEWCADVQGGQPRPTPRPIEPDGASRCSSGRLRSADEALRRASGRAPMEDQTCSAVKRCRANLVPGFMKWS